MPLGAALTYVAHIREYPPSGLIHRRNKSQQYRMKVMVINPILIML